MDDSTAVAAVEVPAPRAGRDLARVRVTGSGTGSPPLPVLARVSHVFCGRTSEVVWPVLHREVRGGVVAPGDLVLLRVGRGSTEEWTELAVAAPGTGGAAGPGSR
jgi:hypothetical protein